MENNIITILIAVSAFNAFAMFYCAKQTTQLKQAEKGLDEVAKKLTATLETATLNLALYKNELKKFNNQKKN